LSQGKVTIVGAGPGDPQLITVRGLNALMQADVVLYDRLTHPDLLRHAPTHAELVYVGKESGQPGHSRQEHINTLLVDYARSGKQVVRLKGGDPFVFGRGGEEVLALSIAGVAFEVVPGVSAAVAVPESALIPVTHRGISSSFAVFAGHDADDGKATGADWEIAARIPTAVFLMGVERLPEIVAELLAHGRRADTPIAVIECGTLAHQNVFIGALHDIIAVAAGAEAPATIVVGDVVTIRSAILANRGGHDAEEISNTGMVLQNDEWVNSTAWRHISELIGG